MKAGWKRIVGIVIAVGILSGSTRALAADESSDANLKLERANRILDLLNDVGSPSATDPEEEKAHIRRVLRLYELEMGDVNGTQAAGERVAVSDEQIASMDSLSDSLEQLRLEIASLRKLLNDRVPNLAATEQLSVTRPREEHLKE